MTVRDGSGPPIDLGVAFFGLLLVVGLALIGVVVVRLLVAGLAESGADRESGGDPESGVDRAEGSP